MQKHFTPAQATKTLAIVTPIPGTGPVVVAVHVGDPRASSCLPDPSVCAAMMVPGT